MLLTDAQIHEIRQIIADYHAAFVVNTVSPKAVPPELLERLKEAGLINAKINSIEDSYLYGQMLAAMDDPKIANMGYSEFKSFLKKNPIPLSTFEQRAVEIAQHSAGQYAVGLGRRIEVQTGATIIEHDQELARRMEDEIKTATAQNIAKRESVKKLKSDLGWATKDWARDWDRIAVTEKNTALQKGIASKYKKDFGPDVYVFKRPMPDACPHCVKAYLGKDGHPIIFKLSDLEANGTNFGKKAADWLPVVGGMHPWCQCQLVRVPQGWGFDKDGDLVPGGAFGERYDSPEEMERAFQWQHDLKKAFKLQSSVRFQGLPIAIENKKGSKRHWKDAEGQTGSTTMKHPYGYVKGTQGLDGDEVDVFLGPDPKSEAVFIVHQQNPQTGIYDEEKVMLGFPNREQAEFAYQEHYDRPDFMISSTQTTVEHFKRWVENTKPKEGKAQPVANFTMKLEKARVAPEIGAQTSRAAHRAPGESPGVNMVIHPPYRAKLSHLIGFAPETSPKEIMAENKRVRVPLKAKKEDYDLGSLPRKVVDLELPDDWHTKDGVIDDEEELERRKKNLYEHQEANIRRPQNKVDVE